MSSRCCGNQNQLFAMGSRVLFIRDSGDQNRYLKAKQECAELENSEQINRNKHALQNKEKFSFNSSVVLQKHTWLTFILGCKH